MIAWARYLWRFGVVRGLILGLVFDVALFGSLALFNEISLNLQILPKAFFIPVILAMFTLGPDTVHLAISRALLVSVAFGLASGVAMGVLVYLVSPSASLDVVLVFAVLFPAMAVIFAVCMRREVFRAANAGGQSASKQKGTHD